MTDSIVSYRMKSGECSLSFPYPPPTSFVSGFLNQLYVCLSDCPSLCLCLSLSLPSLLPPHFSGFLNQMSACLPACPSACLPVCPSVCLPLSLITLKSKLSLCLLLSHYLSVSLLDVTLCGSRYVKIQELSLSLSAEKHEYIKLYSVWTNMKARMLSNIHAYNSYEFERGTDVLKAGIFQAIIN